MKIMIVNIEGYPNLALEKIALWHENQGDEVIRDFPLMAHLCDKIYVSSIFDWNKHKLGEWQDRGAEIGGSGVDLKKILPPEIEAMKPKLNFGFTARGCPRKCLFCIVPQKEGKFRVVGDLLDLWDGEGKKVILLDNNILADPCHFSKICRQAVKHNLEIDFNQGLDHRLLTADICKELLALRGRKRFRFALDSPSQIETAEQAIRLLDEHRIKENLWYVLVGYDTTFQEDLDRLDFLKSHNQRVFVQRFRKCTGIYTALARWANQHHIFQKMTFEQFLEVPREKKYKEMYEKIAQ